MLPLRGERMPKAPPAISVGRPGAGSVPASASSSRDGSSSASKRAR
jgi:hypothetical protein